MPATRASAGSTNGTASATTSSAAYTPSARISAASPAARGQIDQPEHADDREDGDEPAQPGPAGARQVEPGLERLDRRDPAGATGRLDRRGQRDPDADRRAPRVRRRPRTTGPPIGTDPIEPIHAATAVASTPPTTSPIAAPTTPMTAAWTRM